MLLLLKNIFRFVNGKVVLQNEDDVKFVMQKFSLPHHYVEKIEDPTWEFINSWKEKYSKQDPIVLQDLQWFNPEKIGWSDDRWRP